jgi:ribosomal protein S12 methylthiotransferase accessory factor
MKAATERWEKAHFDGTHRVCTPEETLRRIEPVLSKVGVTRLADLTWLDDTGIPVYQAIRPDSYTLSAAQGKGLTPALAKASAAMEAIETWHAERLGPGEHLALGEVGDGLGYRLEEMSPRPRNHINHALRIEWSPARSLVGGEPSLVPTEYLRLDERVHAGWAPPLFFVSSNGLASGNTYTEAVLHGLYEVVERDALARAGPGPYPRIVDVSSVDGVAGGLLDQMLGSGLQVAIEALDSPVGLPSVRVRIFSDVFPEVFLGAGSHLDREVALCRALTEAVQSRVTSISGVRDDLTSEPYRRAQDAIVGRSTRPDLRELFNDTERVPYQELPSVRLPSLPDDLRLVASRVHQVTGREPLVVDHTRPDMGIPVVRVVCPRLLFDPIVV